MDILQSLNDFLLFVVAAATKIDWQSVLCNHHEVRFLYQTGITIKKRTVFIYFFSLLEKDSIHSFVVHFVRGTGGEGPQWDISNTRSFVVFILIHVQKSDTYKILILLQDQRRAQ